MTKKSKIIIAWMTIISFLLYIITDTMELFQSGFSPFQLLLTYIAMMLIPFAVMGLYAIDAKKGGLMYFAGAILISISFIYFSGTATYALAERSAEYAPLVKKLGFIYLFHGGLLVVGGFLFGAALYRAGTAHPIIIVGIVAASLLSMITGLFQLSEQLYVTANFIRNASFASLGFRQLMICSIKDFQK